MRAVLHLSELFLSLGLWAGEVLIGKNCKVGENYYSEYQRVWTRWIREEGAQGDMLVHRSVGGEESLLLLI